MSPYFFCAALLLSGFPSLCFGRSLENRLDSLEQTVHILQTALSEKDNRISQLENELSEVTERVNILELKLEKDTNDHELESDTTNDANILETENMHQERNGTESMVKFQEKTVKFVKSGQSTHKLRRKSSTFPSTRQSIENQSIAFHAYQSAGRVYSTHETIIFDTEDIDIGIGYNNGDGIYSVPASGVYVFSWTIVAHAYTHHEAELMINGIEMGTILADARVLDDHEQASGLIVAHVNAGDHVSVRHGNNNGGILISDNVSGRSTFTGWLLFEV